MKLLKCDIICDNKCDLILTYDQLNNFAKLYLSLIYYSLSAQTSCLKVVNEGKCKFNRKE